MGVAFAIFSAKNIYVFAIFQDRNFQVMLANNFIKFLNSWAQIFFLYWLSWQV